MRFIKIGESYAINADRIVDVSYAAKAYAEERDADGWRDRTPAQVTIRIAGAVGSRSGCSRGTRPRTSGATWSGRARSKAGRPRRLPEAAVRPFARRPASVADVRRACECQQMSTKRARAHK